MGTNGQSTDHPAKFRDCTCPGTPHEEGDIIFLRPTVSLAGGLALERDFVAAAGTDLESIQTDLTARWLVTCIRYGAMGWNVIDDAGPVAFDVEAVIADYTIARPVADVAAELYTDTVLLPLARRLSGISPSGSTTDSTSATAQPTRKPRKRSSRATSAATKLSVA